MLDYEYWSDFLFKETAVCTPAELHGVLTALACVRSEKWKESALTVLDLPEPSASIVEALEAFYELTAKALGDDEYGFSLLLPDDALPINERNRALADWCRGYLFGFGSLGEQTIGRVDDQGQDAIRDIAKIAELDEQVDSGEESETALFELIEYVRIAVIALFTQLGEKPSDGSSELH